MRGARDIMFPEHCRDNGDSMKKKIFVTYNGSIQLHVVVSVACVSSESVRGTACSHYHNEIEITLHLCYRCRKRCLGVQLFKRFPVFELQFCAGVAGKAWWPKDSASQPRGGMLSRCETVMKAYR